MKKSLCLMVALVGIAIWGAWSINTTPAKAPVKGGCCCVPVCECGPGCECGTVAK